MKSLDKKYYSLMIFFITVYVALSHHFGTSEVSQIVSTVLAVIAGVAFFLEYKSNERLHAAEFMMELNHQFVTNENMTSVEHALEVYSNAVSKNLDVDPMTISFGMDLSAESLERQKLVNYLVYLEGIASFINNGVLGVDMITELFGFRYFIAMNNPIVQQSELFPYQQFYRGCFKVYDLWLKELQERDMTPPMMQYSLTAEYEKYLPQQES